MLVSAPSSASDELAVLSSELTQSVMVRPGGLDEILLWMVQAARW